MFTLSWIHIMWFLPLFSRTFPRSLQRITPLPWMSIPLPGGWGWWTRTISPTLCQLPVGGAQPCCLLMVGPILPPSLYSLSLSHTPQSLSHTSLSQSSLSLFSLSACLFLSLSFSHQTFWMQIFLYELKIIIVMMSFQILIFSFEDSKNISQ